MKILKKDFGKVCTIEWDCAGHVDGILVGDTASEGTYLVYQFADQQTVMAEREQFVSLGRTVNYKVLAPLFSRT